MSDSQEKENPFKVSDRRHFNPDGSEKNASPESSESSQNSPEELEHETTKQRAPEISFANLILSLAGSCQTQLGIAPNPFTKQVQKDLAAAKQTIDLLAILAEKTKGNLTREEDQLMQVILTDLRLQFVKEGQ